MGARRTAVSDSRISGPQRLAKYTGTNGNTQGDTKEANPAPKAAKSDTFPTIYIKTCFMLIDLAWNIKFTSICRGLVLGLEIVYN